MADNNKKTYDANSLQALEGLEPVRVRPGMYIGSTDSRGLHHLVWEIVDNSIDEALAGYANEVNVTIKKDGSIMVEDNGRGVPIDINEKTGKCGIELVFTVLHAGGKFNNDSYKVSGGLHGVGGAVVNALSEWFKVWVCKNNEEYYFEFKNGGHPVGELKKLGKSKKEHGTIVQFYPDFSLLEQHDWDEQALRTRLKELAHLNGGIKITFESEITGQKDEWLYNDGLVGYVRELNVSKEPLFEPVINGSKSDKVTVNIGKKDDKQKKEYQVECEIAFQYNKTYNPSIYSFCNSITTPEGGTHYDGFIFAITKVINNYGLQNKLIKDNEEKVNREDVMEGLTAIVSVRHPNPIYEGQTKQKLANTELRQFVSSVVEMVFEKFLLENSDIAKIIIEKAKLAAEGRKRAAKVKEETRRKSPFESNSMPGKLADCSSRDPKVTELYIVEGDSAGGSAKSGREREFQAILPLKGKILNVEKTQATHALSSEEISFIYTAIGTGIQSAYDPEKLRYDKIIIMTDADVDGAHIRILLLTFFFRYMEQLIKDGHVYIAQPPLYKFTHGKTISYAYSDEELEKLKAEVPSGKYSIQRYKGLGEMNPDQLWETTMDPENRVLLKVTIEDAMLADATFSMFMGEDVAPRKEYIEEHATYVKNLDI